MRISEGTARASRAAACKEEGERDRERVSEREGGGRREKEGASHGYRAPARPTGLNSRSVVSRRVVGEFRSRRRECVSEPVDAKLT